MGASLIPAEVIGSVTGTGPFVFLCEHASNRVPFKVSAEERAILDSHWGWDIGAADTVRHLVHATDSMGILAGFSRLVCDANREPSDPTWIVDQVDGQALSFNHDPHETLDLRRSLHHAYHQRVDETIHKKRGMQANTILISIHSFTPKLNGCQRDMDIGVLFDCREDQAESLASEIEKQGLSTALNAPYSGFDHLIYSVNRHGNRHQIPYFELEIRQDLIGHHKGTELVSQQINQALTAWRSINH